MTTTRRSLLHDGHERTWIEVAPEGDVAALVVFLHGSLQSGNVARAFTGKTFDRLTEAGCMVVYPDGIGRHFNDLRRGFTESARTLGIDDVGFLTRLIESYDAPRTIGCGFSNGGQMLIRMLFDAPSTLDGIALFGSSMPAEGNTICSPENWLPTPVLAVQGTADPIVPYEGGIAALGEANRGETRSALDSSAYFARLNGAGEHSSAEPIPDVRVDSWTGGLAPVELWSIEGMGHLVPSPKKLDPRIGPGTDKVVGAELVADFFGLA
ncbi:hypothetical protein [Corynebacterium sp.]|uniref:alpha/beta hydrolase family esterase n=1 Tax=Corynebacterium sp. TaxID=1720 RepID=UPI002A920007|nr:hypothetical protein [Corynebacterium sp.]MDY5785281.1 hypothetical protein [Corynebacterium sp.]